MLDMQCLCIQDCTKRSTSEQERYHLALIDKLHLTQKTVSKRDKSQARHTKSPDGATVAAPTVIASTSVDFRADVNQLFACASLGLLGGLSDFALTARPIVECLQDPVSAAIFLCKENRFSDKLL